MPLGEPMRAGAQNINAEDDIERHVPSELRSRPQIPRTPLEGKRQAQDIPQDLQQDASVKIKGALIVDEVQIKEHGEAFVSTEKIPRTPPEQENPRRHYNA